MIDKNSYVVEELKKALEVMIKDPDLRENYAAKAKEASKQWTKNSYYKDFIKALDVEDN